MHPSTEERTTSNWMKEAQKGYIRVATLIVLSKKPFHGYEIMKEIKERTGGFYRPTPGGVYPILRSLEKAGYIKGKWGTQRNRRIKIYDITERGKSILKHSIIKQSEIAKSMNTLAEKFAREVLNIDEKAGPIPIMPDPFAAFLLERSEKIFTTEELEHEEKELQRNIELLRHKLEEIKKEIAKKKKEK